MAFTMNHDEPRNRGEGAVATDWCASFYKTMPPPPPHLLSGPTNKRKVEQYVKGLLATDDIRMEPESKRIGNPEGLSHLELLQDLQGQLREFKEEQQRKSEEQQKEFKEQQRKFEEQQKEFKEHQKEFGEYSQWLEEAEKSLLIAHANELEWTAGQGDLEERYKRNEISHGGNVRLSIRTIDFLKELDKPDRQHNASTGFKMTYGFDIGKVKPIIAAAPEEIVGILNRRGTLWKLDMWTRNFCEGRGKWIKECDKIVNSWLSGSYAEDEAKQKHNELSQWMTERLDEIRKRYEN